VGKGEPCGAAKPSALLLKSQSAHQQQCCALPQVAFCKATARWQHFPLWPLQSLVEETGLPCGEGNQQRLQKKPQPCFAPATHRGCLVMPQRVQQVAYSSAHTFQ